MVLEASVRQIDAVDPRRHEPGMHLGEIGTVYGEMSERDYDRGMKLHESH
jgi:hypothetical protein